MTPTTADRSTVTAPASAPAPAARPADVDVGGRPGGGAPASARRLRAERTVLRLARPYLPRLAGAGLLAAGTEIAGLALMATATWLLMTAAGRPELDTLTVAIVSVRALAIGRGVLRYTERLAGHDAVLRMVTDVRARVFATLAARPGPVAGQRSGDALSRLVSDVEAVQDLVLRVLVPAAAATVVGLLAVTGTAFLSPVAALCLLAGLLVAGVALPAAATALTRRTADRVAPLRGALAVDAVDLTQGAADLAAFGATPAALDRAGARAAELARLERRLAVTGWAVDAAGTLVVGATVAGVVVAALDAGVGGVLVGVLAVGTLAAVEATLALVGAARQSTLLRAALGRVADLLTPDRRDLPTPAPATTATPTDGSTAAGDGGSTPDRSAAISSGLDCRLGAVTVRYRSGAAPALDDIHLDLPAGRRIAVVGPSGAGKSTLLGVLTGTVRPATGTATLDGTDLFGHDPERLPRLVGGLLAEAYVFHATVRENLLLGRADADTDELAAAVAAAGLLDWIRQQPDGWDTMVGEDGAQLSGGQRQRLALARALLAAPAVLVLDEPTEGLDPAAADAVLAGLLAGLDPRRSLVLVTHRLHGLTGVDEVLVLDAGRIVQRGSAAELASRPGWYRDQWQLQEAAERGYLALGPAEEPPVGGSGPP
ncbi:thiol reductant ABC exporter subunit CydC [Polymorphospora rubra]|uniref:thiol reductant ABC exporter subunit CydC n=1 Tax=Polymorphospora rubra TaxID=338584 RepID=UPI0033F3B42D